MADKLTEKDLCFALSDLFIDNEIDYSYIAKTAIHFELTYVENVLLELVAPVLWRTFFSIVHEWVGYDKDWLWEEAIKVSVANQKSGWIKSQILKIRRKFMAYMLRKKWDALVKEYNRQKF